jgi:glyoxylase-like metal-dependent hydrolase (beta-lactamase superfamily II)
MIDTGDPRALQGEAESLGLDVTMLLQTHAHIDHILGLAEVKKQEKYKNTPIYLHPEGDEILVCFHVLAQFSQHDTTLHCRDVAM